MTLRPPASWTEADWAAWCRARRWRVWLDGVEFARAATRPGAMGKVDGTGRRRRAYRRGAAMILNERTGERWERRGGSWFEVEPWKASGKRPSTRPRRGLAAQGEEADEA